MGFESNTSLVQALRPASVLDAGSKVAARLDKVRLRMDERSLMDFLPPFLPPFLPVALQFLQLLPRQPLVGKTTSKNLFFFGHLPPFAFFCAAVQVDFGVPLHLPAFFCVAVHLVFGLVFGLVLWVLDFVFLVLRVLAFVFLFSLLSSWSAREWSSYGHRLGYL